MGGRQRERMASGRVGLHTAAAVGCRPGGSPSVSGRAAACLWNESEEGAGVRWMGGRQRERMASGWVGVHHRRGRRL
jgi:hypothetical protein